MSDNNVSVNNNRNQLPPLPWQQQGNGLQAPKEGNNSNRLSLGTVKNQWQQQQSPQQFTPQQPPVDNRREKYEKFRGGRDEEDYYEDRTDRDRRRRERRRQRERAEDLRGPGCGCRLIGIVMSLVLLGLLIGLAYILINRPPSIVDPVKDWLNQDLEAVTFTPEEAETAIFNLNSQVSRFNTGENILRINEKELNVLLNQGSTNADLNARIVESELKLYANSDPTSDKPLWLVAKFGIDPANPEDLKLTGVGTERISTPQFLNDALLDVILSTSNFVTQADADSILDFAVDLPSNVRVKKVQLEDKELLLTLDVSTGLEDFFGGGDN